MMTVFVISAMVFFFYAEVLILVSQKVTLLEKLFSFVLFALVEVYYILQLLENLGL